MLCKNECVQLRYDIGVCSLGAILRVSLGRGKMDLKHAAFAIGC